MKKDYLKPEFSVINIQPQTMIAESLKYSDENADKDIEVLSGKQRGDWGNLWK